jgi:hypothetical protein
MIVSETQQKLTGAVDNADNMDLIGSRSMQHNVVADDRLPYALC